MTIGNTNQSVSFVDWMAALRHMAVESFGLSKEEAFSIVEADVQTLYLHGCSPDEAIAALNFA